MRRKTIYPLILASLLLTGCDSSPIVTDENPLVRQEQIPVAFGPYVGNMPSTRATTQTTKAINDDNLKNSGFGVFAYYTDNENYPADQTTYTPDFMYNQPVNYSVNNGGGWVYSPIKYWPNDFAGANYPVDMPRDEAATGGGTGGKISFYAYAPFIENADFSTGAVVKPTEVEQPTGVYQMTGNATASDPILSYRLNFDKPEENVDLLWGTGGASSSPSSYYNASGDKDNNPTEALVKATPAAVNTNYCVWQNCTKMKTGERLVFNFVHALSKIGDINVVIDPHFDEDYNGDGAGSGDFGNKDEDGYTNVTVSEIKLEYGGYQEGTFNLCTGKWELSGTKETRTYTFDASNLNKEIYAPKGGNGLTGQEDEAEGYTSFDQFPVGVTMEPKSIFQTSADLDSYGGGGDSDAVPVTPMVFFFPGETPEIKVTATYTLRSKDQELKKRWTSVPQTISKTIQFMDASNNPLAFATNRSYTLNILLGIEDINFTATVNPWTAENLDPIEVPLNAE